MGTSLVAPMRPIIDLGAFLPFPKNDIVVESRSDETLIRNLIKELDKTLLSAVEARTEVEFASAVEAAFPRYARALRALSDTMRNLFDNDEFANRSASASAVLVEAFEQSGAIHFGEKLTNQALFTLWTFDETRALALRIPQSKPLSGPAAERDKTLVMDYHCAALWGQFHLDCLVASLKFGLSIHEAIREPICEGMRTAVNAFAIVKEAYDLRFPISDQVEMRPPWDEEDEELLAGSMQEQNAELSDDY